jgi:hypothetical protein
MTTNAAPNSRQRFWWPKVDTPENAASAAQYGGVAFAFIALGYAVAALSAGLGWRNPGELGASAAVVVSVVISAIAGLLAWRTFKRPSLLLCAIALAWILVEFVGKAVSVSLPSNSIVASWGQILGAVAGLGGVRGAWAARRFGQLPATGSDWVVLSLIVGVLVGVSALGIWGNVTKRSSNPQMDRLQERLLKSLVPIGAAAICIETFGETPDIMAAATAYNTRNEGAMRSLLAEIDALGGLSSEEKDLLDRKGDKAAKEFLDEGPGARENCNALPARINAHEFDL